MTITHECATIVMPSMPIVDAEIKLGQVQVAIEHRVKEHHVSATEWNLKTERVDAILGDLLWQRDYLIRLAAPEGRPSVGAQT